MFLTVLKFIKSSSKEFNAEVGDSISLREDYMEMAMEATKRDAFCGSLVKKGVSHQIFRFPLYKTEEKYFFCENPY